jgi:predicted ATPase
MSENPWLREIWIENFRGIKDLHLSFLGPDSKPSQIVVIAGPNGSGKTTVLEACLLVAGKPNVTKKLIKGESGRGAVCNGAETFNIRCTYMKDGAEREAEFGPLLGKGTAGLDCEYFSSWRAPTLPGVLSITAGKPGKRPAKTEANRLWMIKQYMINAKAYDGMSSKGSVDRESKYKQVISQVMKLWSMFYPNSGQTFSVEPVGDSPESGFDVFFNDAGSRVPLDALSSGQLELFLLAGSALPGEREPSLICIDEPELHLDPQWHRLILRALRMLRPETQLIVGTHSPEIYEAVLSHERHFLVPSDDPRARAWSISKSGSSEP